MQSAGNVSAGTHGNISVDINPLASTVQSFISYHTGMGEFYADLLTAGLIFAFFLVLSELARNFVVYVAPRLVANTKTSLDDEILKAVRNPIRITIVLLGLYFALKTLDDLSSSLIETLDILAAIVLILAAAYLVSNLIKAVLRWYSRDIAPITGSDLDNQLFPFLEKLLTAIIYVLAFLLILGLFGIQITALVASLGIAGIAVALAAQETLSNVFGAFAILTDRPYKVGDRLLIQGIGQGDVTDIGLRSTRLKTRNDEILVIPNQQMASTEIVNLSMPDGRLRVLVKVGISYKSDIDKACAIMEEIAKADPDVTKDPQPRAYVTGLGDFAVEITMMTWLTDYFQDYVVPDRIYREILARFRDAGIDITYPVMTVLPKVV